MRVDEALETLGGYGRYQLLTFLMIGLNFMYTPMHIFSDVFTAYEPEHHCHVNTEDTENNLTLHDLIPQKYDESSHKYVQDSCSVYILPDLNETEACPHRLHYDLSGGPTIVTEWQLSCNNSQSIMTSTVHGVAAVFGAVIFSPFADTYGRKALFLMCWWQTALLSIGMFFINDVSSYWVLRFLSRLYTEGAELAMFVLACELFPIEQRPFAAFSLYLFYAAGQMLLALQAYLIRNWRYLQLAISVGILILLPFSMFLPESLHWLVSCGRTKDAERIVRRAARINRVSLPPDFSLETPTDAEEEKEMGNSLPSIRNKASGETRLHQVHPHINHFHKLAEYMKNATLRRDFLISSFLWAVSAFLYYGLTVMPIHLEIEDGFFLNYFLGGAVMVPAFCSIFLLIRFGRTKPLAVFFAITGLFVIAYSLTPVKAGSVHLGYVQLTLKLIAKCSTTAALVSTRLLVAEIFPTTVRSTCVGLAAFIGLLGGSAGLYFPIMKKKSKYSGVAVGGLSLLAALCCIRLPETSNRPLPENIKDLMTQYRNVVQNMLFSQMNGFAPESKRKSSAGIRRSARRSADRKKSSSAASRREDGAGGHDREGRLQSVVEIGVPTISGDLSSGDPSPNTYDNPSFMPEKETVTKL